MMGSVRRIRSADALSRGFAAAVVLFLLTPLALVILFAFATNEIQAFPIDGFTLRWFRTLSDWGAFWIALENSAIVTGTVGAISTVTGTAAAIALSRIRRQRASSIMILLSLPVMLPPLVTGIALLSAFAFIDADLGLQTVIPSHVIFTQPFVILIVYARMASFDWSLLDAARDMGASRFYGFRTVTLPIAAPSVIGAALIAMAISLDDFVITYFTIGGGNTLPTLIWGMLRRSITPSVNAIGTLILIGTMGASVLALRLSKYKG